MVSKRITFRASPSMIETLNRIGSGKLNHSESVKFCILFAEKLLSGIPGSDVYGAIEESVKDVLDEHESR